MTKKNSVFIALLVFCINPIFAQKKSVKKTENPPQIQMVNAGKGVLEFDYLRYDFGSINEKGGSVSHDFHFINNGQGPLLIKNVITSCGCTNSDWTRKPIMPGDSGVVRATFDPDGRQGKFDKNLVVETDGSPASISLIIKGHVYPSKFNFTNTYKYQYGNLAIMTNSLRFDHVKSNSYDSTEIGLYNMSNKKIYVYKIVAPNNIVAVKPYDHMPPNTDMRIKVKYYPSQPIEYGPVKQEIRVYTNDDSIPVKVFYVQANIEEDFKWMNKSDLKKAPKAKLNTYEVDLGNISLFSTPTAKFTITNTGKSDLIIRRVIRTCNCLSPELSQTVIPKGKTATLNVVYSLANMAGPDTKTLKVLTNDPNQPEITLSVKINVTE